MAKDDDNGTEEELTDEELDALADKIAERMQGRSQRDADLDALADRLAERGTSDDDKKKAKAKAKKKADDDDDDDSDKKPKPRSTLAQRLLGD